MRHAAQSFFFSEASVLVVDEERMLAEKMAAGDNQAFDALYDRYFPKVYAYVARRCGSKEIAEDLASDIFLKAFTARQTFVWRVSFSAWIFRIAANRLTDHYRTVKHHAPLGEEHEDVASVAASAPGTSDTERLHGILEAVLEKLPERERQAIALKFYAECDTAEIASALGCTPGNAAVILHRALKRCQAQAGEQLRVFL